MARSHARRTEHIASAADNVRVPTKRVATEHQQADHGPSDPGIRRISAKMTLISAEAVTNDRPQIGDEQYYVISRFARMCASQGLNFDPRHSTVLEFGCGSGNMVYVFRDAGFDARGFDLHNYTSLRRPEDKQYFSFLYEQSSDTSDFTADWSRFRLPYANASFDLISSFQVFEHVQNHAVVLREIARVLKPSGATIHIFPAKFSLIEPHIFVPGGTLFKSRLYFFPWALAGIRNESQREWTAWVTAQQNAIYARTGLNYVSPWSLNRLASRWFNISQFMPEIWEAGSPIGERLKTSWFARLHYTWCRDVIWFLARPRAS